MHSARVRAPEDASGQMPCSFCFSCLCETSVLHFWNGLYLYFKTTILKFPRRSTEKLSCAGGWVEIDIEIVIESLFVLLFLFFRSFVCSFVCSFFCCCFLVLLFVLLLFCSFNRSFRFWASMGGAQESFSVDREGEIRKAFKCNYSQFQKCKTDVSDKYEEQNEQ